MGKFSHPALSLTPCISLPSTVGIPFSAKSASDTQCSLSLTLPLTPHWCIVCPEWPCHPQLGHPVMWKTFLLHLISNLHIPSCPPPKDTSVFTTLLGPCFLTLDIIAICKYLSQPSLVLTEESGTSYFPLTQHGQLPCMALPKIFRIRLFLIGW